MMNRIWVWGCFLALTGCSGAAFTGEFAPDSGEADVVGQGDGGGASRSSSSSSGSSSSRTSSSSSADAASVDVDASSCDGGPLYLHHVGLLGLTWQDCVPTGTYNAAQAYAACAAYAAAAADDGGAIVCNEPTTAPCPGTVYAATAASLVVKVLWTYAGLTNATAGDGTGHVWVFSVEDGDTALPQTCPEPSDPAWD